MSAQKKIYVVGHKNPDTDSIVSAIAYSSLKRSLGFENCLPARGGKLNLQTEYILNRFGIDVPEFISDFIPTVRNYMSSNPVTIRDNTPLWEAMMLLNKNNYKMLPIVDSSNKYLSTLHYNAFALNMLNKIDPNKKSVISTSFSLLLRTLGAEPVNLLKEDVMFNAQFVVAAYKEETFKDHIAPFNLENCIVIAGDRNGIQKLVIDLKVRGLIVTGGSRVSDEIKQLAVKNSVSLIISPYDTSTTSWLALNSSPVSEMGDAAVRTVKCADYIKNIKDYFADTVSKTLTVVDQDSKVIGVITQSDLLADPNIDIIMVDHNELTQALDGIENYRILEIIDHHRLGNIHTSLPITFINKPVGSTSTIIAGLYDDHNIKMTKETASILLGGVLSDTIILQSATTTETDRKTAQRLSEISGLDINEYGREIMMAASLVSRKPADEILSMDMKEFTQDGKVFSVSQVEVSSPVEIMDRRSELLEEIERINKNKNYLFTALLVTDITELNSYLFIKGSDTFINGMAYHKISDGIFDMPGILSRKKQLIPILIELIKKTT